MVWPQASMITKIIKAIQFAPSAVQRKESKMGSLILPARLENGNNHAVGSAGYFLKLATYNTHFWKLQAPQYCTEVESVSG